MVNKFVLIVAGGMGTRMNTHIPKQFLTINGKPVLMHTLEVFCRYDRQMRIIVVLPEDQTDAWKNLCSGFNFDIPHEIKPGGETRFHSVQKNLDNIPDDCLVAIHDGVRPLVDLKTIDRCFLAAEKYGNAVPCIEIPETLRMMDNQGTRQVNRADYRLIQTPQVFKGRILKEAYTQKYMKQFTDDAGVVEKMGHTIKLVEGNSENIKITFEKDLIMAAVLLQTVNP